MTGSQKLPNLRGSRVVLTSIPMVGLATGAMFPLIGITLSTAESHGTIGGITAIYYLGSAVGAICAPAIIRALRGIRNAYLMACLALFFSSASLAWIEPSKFWILPRAAGGFALSLAYVTAESWLANRSDSASRSRVFAIYEILRLGAVSLGSMFLLINDHKMAFLTVGLIYLIAMAPLLGEANNFPVTRTRDDRALQVEFMNVLRCLPYPWVLIMCAGAANSSFYGLNSAFGADLDFSDSQIAVFATVVLSAPVFFGYAVGALADKSTRSGTALFISLCSVSAALSLVILDLDDFWSILFLSVAVGAGTVPLYALALTRIVSSLEKSQTVVATTCALLTYSVGATVGPLVSGFFMDQFGAYGFYIALATFSLVASLASGGDLLWARCCPESGRVRL